MLPCIHHALFVLTLSRYKQFVDAIQFYIEIVNKMVLVLRKKKVFEKHEKCLKLAIEFLDFLLSHEVS